MLEIEIPGFKKLVLEHIVLDYNGTMARDGRLLEGVEERLKALGKGLQVHVLTADTFGRVKANLNALPCILEILPPGGQDQGKLSYVRRLGTENTVCIGNGRNDRLMLHEAALGIAVILEEGAAWAAACAADVVCTSITDALDLLLNPLRLVATLRS